MHSHQQLIHRAIRRKQVFDQTSENRPAQKMGQIGCRLNKGLAPGGTDFIEKQGKQNGNGDRNELSQKIDTQRVADHRVKLRR